MAVPSIIVAVAISEFLADKNRCKCRSGTGRRLCIVTSRALNPGLVYGRLCREPRFIRLRPEAQEQLSVNR
jgi:hypothetical protein